MTGCCVPCLPSCGIIAWQSTRLNAGPLDRGTNIIAAACFL
jgi:hypothetical protein